jgi:hypothetical protein
MENIKDKTVSVSLSDLYQFLVSECRYGYTRNNHLMPWGAFRHVYEYLPLMVEADVDRATGTAKQLAEEAISELCRYSFSEDKNKVKVFYTIDWEEVSMTARWVSGVNKFVVDYDFKVVGNMKVKVPSLFKLNDEEASRQTILEISDKGDGKYFVQRSSCQGYSIVLYEPDPEHENCFKSVVWPKDVVEVEEGHEFFLMVSKEDQLDVTEYYEFIRYCLKIIKENGGEKPFNYEDFRGFLKNHPDKV